MITLCGKFLNVAHYFPYDVKLRLLAHSRSFLANQKARNAIVGAENLLIAQFRYIKIQPKTIDLSTRLVGITTEFVGFIPTSLVLRFIVLG